MKCTRCNGTGVDPQSDAIAIDNEQEFELFWTLYGKVGPRKKAHECFMAAVKRGHDPMTITAGLRRWMEYWNTPGAAAMKWPQGFLNQEYFLDSPPAVRVEATRKVMPGRAGIEAAIARAKEADRRQIGSGS